MKNKDRFGTYDAARAEYDQHVVPRFGATRLEWGFGRWLWLDYIDDRLAYWRSMLSAGILTSDGRRRLRRAGEERR